MPTFYSWEQRGTEREWDLPRSHSWGAANADLSVPFRASSPLCQTATVQGRGSFLSKGNSANGVVYGYRHGWRLKTVSMLATRAVCINLCYSAFFAARRGWRISCGRELFSCLLSCLLPDTSNARASSHKHHLRARHCSRSWAHRFCSFLVLATDVGLHLCCNHIINVSLLRKPLHSMRPGPSGLCYHCSPSTWHSS